MKLQKVAQRDFLRVVGAIHAQRIRTARAYADLTQAELAARLGVDEQTIKRRENPAKNDAKKGELIAIAAICGVPEWFLTDGWKEPGRSEIADRLAAIEAILDDRLADDATQSVTDALDETARLLDDSGKASEGTPGEADGEDQAL